MEQSSDKAEAIKLTDLSGAFLFLGVGVSLSVVVFLLEVIFKNIRRDEIRKVSKECPMDYAIEEKQDPHITRQEKLTRNEMDGDNEQIRTFKNRISVENELESNEKKIFIEAQSIKLLDIEPFEEN